MANPIKRIVRITYYVIVPEIPFTPPGETMAGAVTKSARWASAGPVSRGTAQLRAGGQRLRTTRIRIRRAPQDAPPDAGPETQP